MKLLLTSVFKPFAVDDDYGRKENIMELFHNQVTREQGVFSLRYHHESMGLHLMAENISVPTVVLDFPTETRFIAELNKGYDYVGISFIVPNYLKAKRMAELIRHYSPKSKIILGGHGTKIPGLKKLIDCDYICQGEGVHFLRKLFKNDVTAPIKHPILYSAVNKKLMGVPMGNNSTVILTGVGCTNGCRFCCTTHYFNKEYTPFLNSGKEMFKLCQKMEKQLGVREFFIMDENFLKHEERARDLLHEMEKHNKNYSFGIFSSAEAVTHMGYDFLEKLGVSFLWIGAESKHEIYEKNESVDFKHLVKSLRDRGISVLASGILFLEQHTQKTIHEDIDFMVDLNADFVQFMQLGPLPGTKLYKDYGKKGLLRTEIPYEEWHGQHQIWFKHKHFSARESAEFLKYAFQKDYRINGPSILRMIDTTLRGVMHSAKYTSPFMRLRHAQRSSFAREIYPLLDSLAIHSPTKAARRLARDVRRRYDQFFGPRPLADHLRAAAVRALIKIEKLRATVIYNNRRVVKTKRRSYRISLYNLRDVSFVGTFESHILHLKLAFNQSPTTLKLSGILDNKNMKRMMASMKQYLKEVGEDETSLVLNLSNLHVLDEETLRRLFEKLQKYHHQLKLEYSTNIESTMKAIENLIGDFQKLTFVAVPETT